ncbi:hypothetical protein AX14_003984 [Amanita brunnescens Koide BX004]|nr:hypothetical protein AX14_003984 [Amanita brunnescens Koide BX004]
MDPEVQVRCNNPLGILDLNRKSVQHELHSSQAAKLDHLSHIMTIDPSLDFDTEQNFSAMTEINSKAAQSPPHLKHSSALFTGRNEYLMKLRDYFSSGTGGSRKSCLLYGLSGIGKTQIGLKFIEQNSDLFSDIFWIDASSSNSIELGLMQIGEAKDASQGSKQSAGSVLHWISQRANWLMVYDGADDHYQIVEQFLPPGNGGNILITSRKMGMNRLSMTSLKVQNLPEEEAVSLLLESGRLDGTSDHIMNLCRKLASELGGIPLALDKAGVYMLTSQCDIADYLELYTKHKTELLSNPEFRGASDYDTTTYGTWDISIKKIEDMAARGTGEEAVAAQSAIRILRIFCFLDHANIPEGLFKNAAENYVKRDIDEEDKSNHPLSVKLLDDQTLFLSRKGVWEGWKFMAGIHVLISFSLIEAHNQLYSMNLMVHAWNRNRIPKAEITYLYHKARALLSCSIALDYDFDNYAFCKLLAPHVRSNALHASELGLKITYYDDEYERFTLVFHHVGSWDEMERLLLIMAEWRITVLGANHSKTLACIANLVSAYRNQGRWDEAKKLQVDIMDARKAMLGPDHPDTLSSMADLASTYRSQGRWDEAEELEVDIMNTRRAMLGPDHPETLTSMDSLASTYRNQGRWDEAEKLEVEVMNAREAKLGSDHPATLTSMANLASTYWDQGKWDEAEKLEVEVMNASKSKLGSHHPDTLSSMANLASTYRNQGRWDEAGNLQVKVMNARKAKLGSDHSDTLSSMANLASTYLNQGRWDEAEKLFVEVMNAREAKLGSDHPATLTSMANLASTYRNQGRWDEAEKLEVEVMNVRKAKLGSDHPGTLSSMANLSSTYWSQGRLDEAHALLSHVVKMMQQVMGSQHPTVLHYMQGFDKLSKVMQHTESQ